MAIMRAAESLRVRLEQMLSPLRGPGVLPEDHHWVETETEQGVTLRIVGPTSTLLIELEGADPTRPCYARTRRFNVYYATLGERASDLSDPERRILDALVTVLKAREGSLPMAPSAPPSQRIMVREIEVERGLVDEGGGAFYVNPYVGCMLACPFCYASHRAHFSRELEGAPVAEWGRWLDVKVGLPSIVASEARALSARGVAGYVRMSPIVTDPYQPLEKRYRVTRGCLEALVGSTLVPVVLTRSASVLEDRALLASLRGVVGMSITTDDDDVRAAFEPGTEPIDGRIATLAALKGAGLTTFAVIQPMLPMDPARLVSLLAPHVEAVRMGPLYEKYRAEEIALRLGRAEVLDPAWERATFETLRAGFERAGVLVNPTTEPWSVFLR